MPSALVPIFFLSGIAGLTFETLWFRLAGLSLGNSVWSASLVLAAFMGGLTLGNGLVARFHSRIAHPIKLYARLELAIGIGSFLVVLALPRLSVRTRPAIRNRRGHAVAIERDAPRRARSCCSCCRRRRWARRCRC